MNQIQKEILEIVRELPGSTREEIAMLMPHERKNSVFRHISHLMKSNRIRAEKRAKQGSGPGRAKSGYYLVPERTLKLVPRDNPLQAELDELRAWKADAIARYPDLGVDPIVLEAREIVAGLVDEKLAADVRSGRKDGCPIMLATIQGLSRGRAA